MLKKIEKIVGQIGGNLEIFYREMEYKKKNHVDIPEVKILTSEINNSLHSFHSDWTQKTEVLNLKTD